MKNFLEALKVISLTVVIGFVVLIVLYYADEAINYSYLHPIR